MKTKIRVYPDPVLRIKAEKVDKIDKTIINMIKKMYRVMQIEEGVGLAANQVGITKRIILIDDSEHKEIMINPEIIKFSDNTIEEAEGCLSLPGVLVNVNRYERIVVKFMDEKGNIKKREYTNFFARAIQHEIDHLNGVLLIDYMEPEQRLNFELNINKKEII